MLAFSLQCNVAGGHYYVSKEVKKKKKWCVGRFEKNINIALQGSCNSSNLGQCSTSKVYKAILQISLYFWLQGLLNPEHCMLSTIMLILYAGWLVGQGVFLVSIM